MQSNIFEYVCGINEKKIKNNKKVRREMKVFKFKNNYSYFLKDKIKNKKIIILFTLTPSDFII